MGRIDPSLITKICDDPAGRQLLGPAVCDKVKAQLSPNLQLDEAAIARSLQSKLAIASDALKAVCGREPKGIACTEAKQETANAAGGHRAEVNDIKAKAGQLTSLAVQSRRLSVEFQRLEGELEKALAESDYPRAKEILGTLVKIDQELQSIKERGNKLAAELGQASMDIMPPTGLLETEVARAVKQAKTDITEIRLSAQGTQGHIVKFSAFGFLDSEGNPKDSDGLRDAYINYKKGPLG